MAKARLVTDDPRWDSSLTVESWDMFTGHSAPGIILSMAHPIDRSRIPSRISASHGGGYIYCLALPGDIYKVGLTQGPSERIAQHRRSARQYGLDPEYIWISPAHKEFRQSERDLIEHLMPGAEFLGSESFRRPGLFHDVCEWWATQEVHPPGEFAWEHRARLGI